jgi:hypothetical protein
MFQELYVAIFSLKSLWKIWCSVCFQKNDKVDKIFQEWTEM